MGAGVPQSTIKRTLNKMARTYPGVEFRVLYASNGEVAILPVNPNTGKPEIVPGATMRVWSDAAQRPKSFVKDQEAYDLRIAESLEEETL